MGKSDVDEMDTVDDMMMLKNEATPPCQTPWLLIGCSDCNDHVAFSSLLPLERRILPTSAKFQWTSKRHQEKSCRCYSQGMIMGWQGFKSSQAKAFAISLARLPSTCPISCSTGLILNDLSLTWHDIVVLNTINTDMLIICWSYYIANILASNVWTCFSASVKVCEAERGPKEETKGRQEMLRVACCRREHQTTTGYQHDKLGCIIWAL